MKAVLISANWNLEQITWGIIQQIFSVEVYRLTKMSSCYLCYKSTAIKYYVQ